MRYMPGECSPPERLLPKLQLVSQYGATIIAAPSGYGKTTAVQWMQGHMANATFVWCPAVWEDPHNGWRSFCEQVALFDSHAARHLSKCDVLGAQAEQAADTLRHLTCPIAQATYFIIDDFHLFQRAVPQPVIQALISHTCPRLHVVLMGQGFMRALTTRYGAFALNWIGPEDLLFRGEDIRACFESAGVDITEEQVEQVLGATHGWPAAVGECRQAALPNAVRGAMSTASLLSRLALDRLGNEERCQVLPLAFFDAVSEGDLCTLWDKPQLDDADMALLACVPLLHEQAGAHQFALMPALQSFLRVRLQNVSPAVREKVHVQAGRAFAVRGDLVGAIGCYYAIRDYQSILGLDLKLLSYTRINGVPFETIAADIVANCPMETKRAHPIALLRLAYHLYGAGELAAYQQALAQAQSFISREQDPALYGEWLVVSMYGHMPDLESMHRVLLEAEPLLLGTPRAIPPEEPFLFGCPSVWMAFYSTPGAGERIGQQLSTLLQCYRRIFGARGFGADQLFQGELHSMRMHLAEAENYAYTAAALGEQAGQPTTVFGAALLRARIAIAKQDMTGALSAIHYLDNSVQLFPHLRDTVMLRYMQSSVRGLMLSMLQEAGLAAAAKEAANPMPRGDSLLAQLGLHVRVVNLVMQGEVERGLGEMSAAISRQEEHPNVVMRLTLYAAMAVCLAHLGMRDEAMPHLERALALAWEDDMKAMFVNHRAVLGPLLKHPSLSKYSDFVCSILSYGDAQPSAQPALPLRQLAQFQDVLTEREREVAELAAQGFRNAEIAARLFISENTVKKHMQTIFEKLDIDRRARLIELLNR